MRNLSKVVFGIVLTLMFGAPASLQAQDALDNLTTTMASMFQQSVGDAIPALLEGAALISEARGLKEHAAELRASAEQAKAGASEPDRESGERLFTVASSAAEELASFASEGASEMTGEQQEFLVAGIIRFFEGTSSSIEVAGMIPDMTSAIQGISAIRNPMQLRRTVTPVAIARLLVDALPAMVTSNIAAADAIRAYVTANNIPVDLSQFSFK